MSKRMTKEQKFLAASGQLSAVLSAGFSASELRSAGYSASEVLSAAFSARAVLSAGFSASALRSAGFSASALRSAGFSASEVLSAGFTARELEDFLADVPLVERPYSRLWADLKAKDRVHKQSTFGPETAIADDNVCGTPMCTAGHLVQMAGAAGYALRKKYGWVGAAALIHMKAHPDDPPQNFGSIPQDWALAYIETMAKKEASQSR